MFLNQIIIREDQSRKFIRKMRLAGIKHYSVVRASGTANSEILKSLGLEEKTMEMIWVFGNREETDKIKNLAREKFHFENGGLGVCFATDSKFQRGDKMEATAIYVIADRGLADDVIEVAVKAGGSGATVLHGRGSGIEKRVAIFDMVIEPEKDIIVLVTSPDKKDGIVDAINSAFDLEKTSKGVIFTMPVTDAVGFNFNR